MVDERLERIGQRPLERARAGADALALDDVEVGERRGARGGVARVRGRLVSCASPDPRGFHGAVFDFKTGPATGPRRSLAKPDRLRFPPRE